MLNMSRSETLALGSGIAGLVSLWLTARTLRPKKPLPALAPAGDLYPSGLPDVLLWGRSALPRIKLYFDRATLGPEDLGTKDGEQVYVTPDGERFWTVTERDEKPVLSASQTISFVLDDGADVAVWTTPDLSRVRCSPTPIARAGWVLLAHATDRGAF